MYTPRQKSPSNPAAIPAPKGAPPAPPAPKSTVETRPFVLKVKPDGAPKWKTLGYVNLRVDLSGGVATLFTEGGGRIERIAVFPHEKKAARDGAAADAAAADAA